MLVAGISSSAWYLNFNRSLDEHAMRYARMHMERFQDAVQRYVMMTAMIESMLRDMGGYASRFRRLARYLAEGDSGILLLAIAPKGAEPIACPGDGVAQVLRFLDSLKLQYADPPQPSGRTAVFGPLGLEDGQAALAARRPIFLMGTCGMPYFWGFAILVIDPARIFESKDLHGEFDQPFQVLEASALGQGSLRTVFQSGAGSSFHKAVNRSDFLERTWVASLSFDTSWAQLVPEACIFIGVWACFVLLGVAVGCALLPEVQPRAAGHQLEARVALGHRPPDGDLKTRRLHCRRWVQACGKPREERLPRAHRSRRLQARQRRLRPRRRRQGAAELRLGALRGVWHSGLCRARAETSSRSS